MLDKLDRDKVFDGLKKALSLHGWNSKQVSGLTAFFDEAEGDSVVPDGIVGIQRAAYWIYTMAVETNLAFQPIHEYGGRSYFIRRYGPQTRKGRELGNDTEEEAVAYSGVGLVQTTGENNVERLEAYIREHYPQIAAAVERDTGKPFDLTIGDQPDDRADVENMTRFDVAYVALVAGTTLSFYGPPLGRYIKAGSPPDYRNARRCVNGTDRADEFAVVCPKIERALVAARRSAAQSLDMPPAALAPDEIPSAAPTSAVDAAAAPGPTTTVEQANVVRVEAPASTVPLDGAGKDDPAKQVTSSWPGRIAAGLGATGITGAGLLEFLKSATGDVLKWSLLATAAIVVVYLITNAVGKWHVRAIAADPTKLNVK